MTKLLIKKFIKNFDDVKNPKIREKYGFLSGFVGIFCNVLLTVMKFVIGTVTNSISITADAANNLSDASSSIITLVGAKISNKPADKEHPFGHGRIEYISALVVSFMILIMGFELMKTSVAKILHPEEVAFNLIAFIVLMLTIPIKLWMAYFNNKLYKKTDAPAMKAVCQDSLNDCIATGATVISLLVSAFSKINIDGYIGAIVAVLILIAGVNMIKDIVAPLLGQAPDKEVVKEIEDIIMSYDMVIGVHDLIVHNYGPSRVIASAHAEVPANVNIMEIHDVIDNIETEIMKRMNIMTVIHMDPLITDNERINELKEQAKTIVSQLNPDYSFHDFRVVEGPSHTNIIFDLIIPHKNAVSNSEIIDVLTEKFKELDEKYFLVVNIEHSFI